MPNGTSEAHRLPAEIYPGVFPGEYQVTVNIGGKEIHLNVGEGFVEVDKEPTEAGVDGFLRVQLLEEGGNFLVALPGEVQGESSRVQVTREALGVT